MSLFICSLTSIADEVSTIAELILGLRPDNEKRRYDVTLYPTGLAQTWNHPCNVLY